MNSNNINKKNVDIKFIARFRNNNITPYIEADTKSVMTSNVTT